MGRGGVTEPGWEPVEDIEAELRRVAEDNGTAWGMCDAPSGLLIQAADRLKHQRGINESDVAAARNACAERIAELRDYLRWCIPKLPDEYAPHVEGWLRADENKGRVE